MHFSAISSGCFSILSNSYLIKKNPINLKLVLSLIFIKNKSFGFVLNIVLNGNNNFECCNIQLIDDLLIMTFHAIAPVFLLGSVQGPINTLLLFSYLIVTSLFPNTNCRPSIFSSINKSSNNNLFSGESILVCPGNLYRSSQVLLLVNSYNCLISSDIPSDVTFFLASSTCSFIIFVAKLFPYPLYCILLNLFNSDQ